MHNEQIWHSIKNDADVKNFMESVCYFHDSCIKELKYTSGAYVDDTLAMHPLNNARVLSIIIQRQFESLSMLELCFEDLKYLKLFPIGTDYTCEILGASMFISDGCIYWGDSEELSAESCGDCEGMIVCAGSMSWRQIDGCMGEDEFFRAAK